VARCRWTLAQSLFARVLVVAPVALLENWRSEIEKFFEPGALPTLTLYGSTIKGLRVHESEVAASLAEHGITKILRKGWVGDAKVVLTTYETLRDLEFTLAAQDWSIMVCDEAQKIKNPSAMVTRSAKKQKVRFRVACTGTPVENTLLDLWCRFDFIQPGLLGALNQFSRIYKQPIEAKTYAQRQKVAELRRLIEPQTLRRTKLGVAKDIVFCEFRDLQIQLQRVMKETLQLDVYVVEAAGPNQTPCCASPASESRRPSNLQRAAGHVACIRLQQAALEPKND
jgi:SNF2 family DNA or RNA helicase